MSSNSIKIGWQSPSNIALVKYWGKYGNQFPINPSISITLSNAYTESTISFTKKSFEENVSLAYYFEKSQNTVFENKILLFLSSLLGEFSFLKEYHLIIESRNTFPHSAGIASSASSMGALALCLVDFEYQLMNKPINSAEFYNRASYFARLGSGSASRSVYPEISLWGETDSVIGSSQDFAIAVNDNLHADFRNYQDSILIIDSSEKKVSSRAGHALMNNHPYAEARKIQANNNIDKLLSALKEGDLEEFIKITENEALSLHALMLSSTPWYSLLKPATLIAIEQIKMFRQKTNIPVCFTLDAGPNVHILYPEKYKTEIGHFISYTLLNEIPEAKIIYDQMGMGPQKMI